MPPVRANGSSRDRRQSLKELMITMLIALLAVLGVDLIVIDRVHRGGPRPPPVGQSSRRRLRRHRPRHRRRTAGVRHRAPARVRPLGPRRSRLDPGPAVPTQPDRRRRPGRKHWPGNGKGPAPGREPTGHHGDRRRHGQSARHRTRHGTLHRLRRRADLDRLADVADVLTDIDQQVADLQSRVTALLDGQVI